MIGKLVMGGAVLALMMSAPVGAADIDRMQMDAAATDWTGVYLGVHGGYARGDADSDEGDDTHPSDPFLGAQAGFNWQANTFIFGAEADFSLADLDGDSDTVQQDVDNLFSVRGRAGLALGSLFPFITAGGAWADSERDLEPGIATDDASLNGWVAGLGAEYALGQHWSGRLEYLHYDFGDATYQLGAVRHEVDISVDAIRAAINWRF
jgi:outer membrane immunogenic protein